MSALDDLLIKSMRAHNNARKERLECVRKSLPIPQPQPLLMDARRLRIEAMAMDPGHRDPAWAREVKRMGKKTIHEDCLAFYDRKLGVLHEGQREEQGQ